MTPSTTAATVRREILAYLLAGLAAHSIIVNRHFRWLEISTIAAAAGLHIPQFIGRRKKELQQEK